MPDGVLLVEGEDDEHVVRQLCNRFTSIPEFSIRVAGNVDKLLDAIGAAMRVSNTEAVGVLMDANDRVGDRWNALRARLAEEAISVPDWPNPEGMIIEIPGSPRIGVWLMPDNEHPGEIEDFVSAMIPSDDPVWPRSQRYVEDIPAEHRRFRPGKLLRAQLYAWLATREIPGRMGAAIGAGDLNVESAESIRFVNWLRDLFR